MDRKITNLIICVLICFVLILVLFIFKFAVVNPEVNTEEKLETVLEETAVDDPVEGDFKIHTSKNGYTVKYPENMQATQMAKSIDFILNDENSGSSLNIVTAVNDGTLKKMTKEEFEHSLSHTSEDAVMLGYEEIDLNGTDAVKASFTYMDKIMDQYIIITEDISYNITVTKSEDITDEMSVTLDRIAKSFTLN